MMKQPFQQGYSGSCGPASLKIALAHFGIKKTEKELKKLTKCGKDGIELEDLLKVANKFGLKGYIRENSDFKTLKRLFKNKKNAIIVGWFYKDDGHYSVVANIDKENVYLQDPEIGQLRAMRIELFKRVWFDFPGDFIEKKEDLQLRKMLILRK